MIQRTNYNLRFTKSSPLELYVILYTAWHESDPAAGHDIQAAVWQTNLDALNAGSETDAETAVP